MVIKMSTIDGADAANAINYVLDKEKARKEDKPVFLAANNIELNPLTGKPYSPVAETTECLVPGPRTVLSDNRIIEDERDSFFYEKKIRQHASLWR